MADRDRLDRGRVSSLAGLAARAALVVGSVAMAVRVAVPRSQPATAVADADPADPKDSGRGHPTIAPSRQSLRTGHETADMSAPTMWRVMAALAGVAAVSVFLMLAFQSVLLPSRARQQASLTPQETSHPAPPPPNLQADPVAEITRLRTAEDHLLDRYQRLDATHARIPIDRAMTLIVGHPLDTAP